MRIKVNGNWQDLPESPSLQEILATQGISPEQGGIAVAVNLSVVPRDQWIAYKLTDGDEIEVVSARQGG